MPAYEPKTFFEIYASLRVLFPEISVLLGAGAIALTRWFAKVAAENAVEAVRNENKKQLLALKSSYDAELETLKSQLEILKNISAKGLDEKLQLYKSIGALIAEALADIQFLSWEYDTLSEEGKQAFWQRRYRLEVARVQAYGNLALIAPQAVMELYEELESKINQFTRVRLSGQMTAEIFMQQWNEVRECGVRFLNEVRKDLGLNATPIHWTGKYSD